MEVGSSFQPKNFATVKLDQARLSFEQNKSCDYLGEIVVMTEFDRHQNLNSFMFYVL